MALFTDQTTPALDASMQEVLDATAELGQQPLETLSPEAARMQPLPGDGAKVVMARRGLDPDDDLGVTTRDITIPGPAGPISVRLYDPDGDETPKPIVIYWHGGGWVIAGLDDYDATPRALAKATGCLFVSCHYRQGPEHKFPAAHDDAQAAWDWLTAHATELGGDGERFALVGESAGGNLAANVAIRARDAGGVQPQALVLVYPVASNDMDSPSYREHAAAKPLSQPLIEWMLGHYLNSPGDAADPRINLVAADLAGLPETTIINAEIDPLRSDGEALAVRLEQAGVDVAHACYKGVTHEFFGMGLVVKDAAAAQGRAAMALRKGLRYGLMGKIADALS